MSRNRERLWCSKDFAEMLRLKAVKNGFKTPAKYTEYLAKQNKMEGFFKTRSEEEKKKKFQGGKYYDSFF